MDEQITMTNNYNIILFKVMNETIHLYTGQLFVQSKDSIDVGKGISRDKRLLKKATYL